MAVMISIRPKWVEKILKGEKTVEIRKTMPKCALPCKVYIYCTKGDRYLCKSANRKYDTYFNAFISFNSENKELNAPLNKKIVAEFTLKQVDILEYCHLGISHTNAYVPTNENADYEWVKHGCVDYNDIVDYGKCETLYAYHIDDLIVYDKAKELREFGIKQAPQSWCYCEKLK